MEKIKVKVTMDKSVREITETVYNVHDYPYQDFIGIATVRKKNINYVELPATFDIESTTVNKSLAFMYHAQFCFCGKVCFMRTWEEFEILLQNLGHVLSLQKCKQLVIYVHFLSYEFQFIKDFLHIEHMFAKEKRKPLTFNACLQCDYDNVELKEEVNELPFFEFRCSYFLSNMSLAKFCENSKGCIHYKYGKDTYNYRKLRTPATLLTEEEQGYCFNDVKGLEECIMSRLENDTLASIPLTSTGYVRRDCRRNCATRGYRDMFASLKIDAEIYTMLRTAFRGGNTHASRYYANAKIKDVVSYDRASSYPAVMCADKYPMTPFVKIDDVTFENILKKCNTNAVLLEVDFYNIELKYDVAVPYIDIGHCNMLSSDRVNDNGRILKANYLRYTMTDIDFLIILNQYTFDNITINKAYESEYEYLPTEIIEIVFEYFRKKTMLKNVKGSEYEYAKSKNNLNSTFGMIVTAIDNEDVYYDSNLMEWGTYTENLDTQIERYWNSRNSFLAYQWGVWVTAHARYELQVAIDAVGFENFVYCDTDSVKFIENERVEKWFESRNFYIRNKKSKYLNYIELNGKEYILGIWENDGVYDYFKTLGAKKYAYVENGELYLTVSGLGKEAGSRELMKDNDTAIDGIDDFKVGKVFADSGRTVSYFNDEKPHKVTVEGCTFTTASSIAVLDTTYTLGITDEYAEIIGYDFEVE